MKKIRILTPIGELYPNESGGVSLAVYWLLKALNELDIFNLTTITTTKGIKTGLVKSDIWENSECGRLIYLKVHNHKYNFKFIRYFIAEVRNCDVVHLCSIFYPPSIICFFISLAFNKKVVWSTHGSLDDVEFQKKGFFKSAFLFVLKFFIKNVTFHTTINEETNFVKKRLGLEVKIIQINYHLILEKKIDLKKEKYLLFIGRFHPKKGIENLLKALQISKTFSSSQFCLKLAGDFDNPYGNHIKQLCTNLNLDNKVHFLGSITGHNKHVLLAKAYWSFMPSFSENFGIVAAEALAQGTPVLASTNTPWESLNTYKAGFWIDNTPEVLANFIDKIISLEAAEYYQYSNNALDLIEKEFNSNDKVKRWVNTYLSTLGLKNNG